MSEALNLPCDTIKKLQKRAYVNYEAKSLNDIFIRLPRMYTKAHENLDSNEIEKDETAFIFLTRWLNTVKWIKNKDEKLYFQKIDSNQIKKTEQLIKTLSEKIVAHYSQNLTKTVFDRKGSIDKMDLDILPSTNEKCKVFSDVTLKFPETPTDDPLNTEIEEFIPCNQLYQIMRKEDPRFLIIDIRPQTDYEMSKINTCKCINIPENEISEGKTASRYEKDLAKDLKSKELFRTRGSRYVDILVLLDWKTKKESLLSSNPLNIFKETLLKWDPATKYKKIVILDGGYNEWLMRYPAYTTNPNVTISETDEVNNDILEDFVLDSYPIWVNNDDENTIKKQSQSKSNFIKDKSIIQDSLDDRQLLNNFETKISSTISSTLSNNNINLSVHSPAGKTTGIYKSVYGESIIRDKNIPSKLLQHNITKPIIDRSNKPTSVKTSDPNSKEVLRLMRELNESYREMEKLVQKIYDTETSLYNQNIKNKGFKEDSTIHTDLESMKSELNILQKTHNKNEKELNKYKEVGTIQFSNEEQEEKSKLDFNFHKVRQRLKDISGHRKRLHEKSLEKDHKDISIKQNDKDIHMEPLKTDSSISSDHKAPEVDRSSKPQISSQYQHTRFNNETNRIQRFNWGSIEEKLTPIHGNVVAIGQYKLQFSSYEQQDSHEFLTFLLDWMHSELKKKVKIQAKMTIAEKEWDKAMDSQESIISELFFGQLRSTITCSSCQKDSTTYETFNSLTMSLPHTNRCTLDDCIQRFVTGQKVLGWKCPKCQTPREATKKFDFIKLAPIIVIHLNRFAESGGWLEKRNTTVDFPLKEFNLKPYLITDHDAPMNNARFCTYNLYAMSNHYGTMEGGHYTAYCKNNVQNKWYKYDDQTVTEVSPSQVKSQNNSAYLLFYTSLSNTYI
ncbi:hypothetical protein HZH68_002335 [Vespula germanica]|uniref:ubiquitinyl hydrolase 1 n=1 Tax=Vespula germanica TaxID=30212 RepID=A0A834KXU9_VESGE|nr:hypothetical protein HZH68_002335 [Vespula germanica]